jgi:hypothetical protein
MTYLRAWHVREPAPVDVCRILAPRHPASFMLVSTTGAIVRWVASVCEKAERQAGPWLRPTYAANGFQEDERFAVCPLARPRNGRSGPAHGAPPGPAGPPASAWCPMPVLPAGLAAGCLPQRPRPRRRYVQPLAGRRPGGIPRRLPQPRLKLSDPLPGLRQLLQHPRQRSLRLRQLPVSRVTASEHPVP